MVWCRFYGKGRRFKSITVVFEGLMVIEVWFETTDEFEVFAVDIPGLELLFGMEQNEVVHQLGLILGANLAPDRALKAFQNRVLAFDGIGSWIIMNIFLMLCDICGGAKLLEADGAGGLWVAIIRFENLDVSGLNGLLSLFGNHRWLFKHVHQRAKFMMRLRNLLLELFRHRLIIIRQLQRHILVPIKIIINPSHFQFQALCIFFCVTKPHFFKWGLPRVPQRLFNFIKRFIWSSTKLLSEALNCIL